LNKKVPKHPKSFPKQKHKQLIISHLHTLSRTKSFPFLKISQLHLIIYKVQQTHRSNKTVGFVFFVSQVPSLLSEESLARLNVLNGHS
jgi:hypothetical protein